MKYLYKLLILSLCFIPSLSMASTWESCTYSYNEEGTLINYSDCYRTAETPLPILSVKADRSSLYASSEYLTNTSGRYRIQNISGSYLWGENVFGGNAQEFPSSMFPSNDDGYLITFYESDYTIVDNQIFYIKDGKFYLTYNDSSSNTMISNPVLDFVAIIFLWIIIFLGAIYLARLFKKHDRN